MVHLCLIHTGPRQHLEVLCHQYPEKGCQQGTKFRRISLVNFLLEKGENTNKVFDTHVEDIKPPLTIVYVGNGCEAYSSNLYIPAKSELTSRDDTLVRYVYFQQFNEDYQNLTKYSLIEDSGIKQLTDREIENLPDCLAALPILRFNELKRRLKDLSTYTPVL